MWKNIYYNSIQFLLPRLSCHGHGSVETPINVKVYKFKFRTPEILIFYCLELIYRVFNRIRAAHPPAHLVTTDCQPSYLNCIKAPPPSPQKHNSAQSDDVLSDIILQLAWWYIFHPTTSRANSFITQVKQGLELCAPSIPGCVPKLMCEDKWIKFCEDDNKNYDDGADSRVHARVTTWTEKVETQKLPWQTGTTDGVGVGGRGWLRLCVSNKNRQRALQC